MASGDTLIRTLVLDSEGVSKAAVGDPMTLAHLDQALRRRIPIVASAATLVEVLRGARRDAAVHRILRWITVESLTHDLGRRAGELLGRSGLGPESAIDAMVAVTAIEQPRPTVVLTSDPKDLAALTRDEPGVTVMHV